MQGRRKSLKVGGAWGGGLGAEPPVGGQGGKAPPEADEVFVFKTLIFNASAIVLHEMTHCLSCFLCADVCIHEFDVKIVSTITLEVTLIKFGGALLRCHQTWGSSC